MMSGASTALSQAKAKPSATYCVPFRSQPNRTYYFIIKAFCSKLVLSCLYTKRLLCIGSLVTAMVPPFSVVAAFALRLVV